MTTDYTLIPRYIGHKYCKFVNTNFKNSINVNIPVLPIRVIVALLFERGQFQPASTHPRPINASVIRRSADAGKLCCPFIGRTAAMTPMRTNVSSNNKRKYDSLCALTPAGIFL